MAAPVSKDSAVPEVKGSSSETPEWLRSLEPKYHPVLLHLLERDSWTRADFDALAKKFQLIPFRMPLMQSMDGPMKISVIFCLKATTLF